MCPKSPMDVFDKAVFGGVKEIAVGWKMLTLCSLLGTLVQSAQVLLMSAGEGAHMQGDSHACSLDRWPQPYRQTSGPIHPACHPMAWSMGTPSACSREALVPQWRGCSAV